LKVTEITKKHTLRLVSLNERPGSLKNVTPVAG